MTDHLIPGGPTPAEREILDPLYYAQEAAAIEFGGMAKAMGITMQPLRPGTELYEAGKRVEITGDAYHNARDAVLRARRMNGDFRPYVCHNQV